MAKLQVLSKGKYLDLQPNQPVTLSQYIFAIQDKAKYLLLRFKNERGEVLTGMKFAVKQLNAKGNEIETSIVECSQLKGGANSMFTLNKKIEVKRDCADFKVYLISANYGKYVYSVKNHATYLSYQDAITVNRLRQEDVFKRIGSLDRVVNVRKTKKPIFTAVMAIVALVMLIATAILQTVGFKSSSKRFTLYNINYEIVGDDAIRIIGYRGEAVNVTIPESIEGYNVVGITEKAFENNVNLKRLVINCDIEIPYGAFRNCDKLISVELKQVTKIGESAFENCDSLSTISADNLEEIEQNAFNSCPVLATVQIENNFTKLRIGRNAFANCASLNLVEINQDLNFSNVNIFEGSVINELHLESVSNRQFKDYFGDSAAKVNKLVIDYAEDIPNEFLAQTEVKSLTINSLGVESIYAGAFKDNVNLEEIVFGSKIVEIGESAFENTSLKTFNFKGVEIVSSQAFKDCEDLASVDFTNSEITNLPQYVFSGCKQLKTVKISSKITAIEQFAFSDCSSLAEVQIPANVETIGLGAFLDCFDLKKMTIHFIGGSLLENNVMGYLFASSTSDSYQAPASLAQISITSPDITVIPEGAFYGFNGLEKVTFASPIEKVEQRAFYNCKSLKDFPFTESLTEIGVEAFANTGFTEITIPSSVKDVGAGAFADCKKLKTVKVPTTVESLGEYFLGDCPNLEELVLPYMGRNIEESFPLSWFTANSPLDNLKSVTITSDEYKQVASNAFLNARALEKVELPPAVQSIGERAFEGCESLENIALPDTVEEIGKLAFANTKLREFKVPKLVTSIETETFLHCRHLREVTLHQGVTHIGDGAFSDCLYLHEVYNYSNLDVVVGSEHNGEIAKNALIVYGEGDQPAPKVINGAYEFLSVYGDWVLVYCHDEVEKVKLPSKIEYQGVEVYSYDVANYTFMNRESIKSLGISSAVRKIGDKAFYCCVNLSNVSVEEGKLSHIGEQAFYNCQLIENFDFVSSLRYIGEQAFYNCYSLSNIILSCYLEEIKNETFYNCVNVQSIVLPSTLERIEENAFYGCQYVLNIVLPASLSYVGDNAFYGCQSLMSVHNRSYSLSVNKGSSSNGGVAKYAKTVKGPSDFYLFEVFTDGEFKVICDNYTYWIYKYEGSLDNYSILKLPDVINHNGGLIYQYGLSKDTFVNVSGYFELYLPASVVELDQRVFYNNCPSTIYYGSDNYSWRELTDNVSVYASVYCYSHCNHDGQTWKYDDRGNITTSIDQPTYTTVVPAGCETSGYSRWDCPYCSHYETREDYPLGHNFASNGQCSRCPAQRIKITSQNINNYRQYVIFSLGNSFTIDKNGMIKSKLVTGYNADMFITIMTAGVILEFDYGMSSSTSLNYATIRDFECGSREYIIGNYYHYNEYVGTGTITFSCRYGDSYYSEDFAYIRNIYLIIG